MARMDLSPQLKVPDLTTETIGIIGKRGSGKSHTGTLVVEELLELDSQVIVIDPIGGWWGLRAGADGKSSGGFSIPIFGGLHGDVPLQDSAGSVVADYVIENRLSAVLDLSGFSKSAMRRFVRDFAERFYLLKNKARDPVHVVIDECDLFVPQRVESQEMMPLVGAINDFVLRGRQRGIGVTLISQRPARINKDVLTQVEILIAFRLTGPQDIKAFGEWIEHNGSKDEQKEVLGTLSSLERGTGWFWAPGLMDGLLKKVEFRARRTYDSSRTPDGKKVKPPKTLRDVDLDQLTDQMRATVEQAKANDPKALKAQIETLKREFAKARAAQLSAEARAPRAIVEVPTVDKTTLSSLNRALGGIQAANEHIEKVRERFERAIDAWSQRAQVIVTAAGTLTEQLKKASGKPPAVLGQQRNGVSQTGPTPSRRAEVPKSAAPQGSNGSDVEVKVPREFVAAVAQFGDSGATRKQLTQVFGTKTSTRNAYVARGCKAGLFIERGDHIVITEDGVAWLGDDYEVLPTGAELLAHWLKKLPGGQRECLQAASEVYPESISRDEIGEQHPDWAISTRNAYIARVVARQLLEEVSRTHVRMADMLSEDS